MTDTCSALAYQDIIKSGYLGERQMLVLKIFIDEYPGEFTATDLVGRLGRGVSENVRNRITELQKMGLLEKTTVKRCEITGRAVNLYKWTGRTYPYPKQVVSLECRRCHGTGKTRRLEYVKEDPKQQELF